MPNETDQLAGRSELVAILKNCFSALCYVESQYQQKQTISPFATISDAQFCMHPFPEQYEDQDALLYNEIKAIFTTVNLLQKMPNKLSLTCFSFIAEVKSAINILIAGLPHEEQRKLHQQKITKNEHVAPYLLAAVVTQLNYMQHLGEKVKELNTQAEEAPQQETHLVAMEIPKVPLMDKIPGSIGENAITYGLPLAFKEVSSALKEIAEFDALLAANEECFDKYHLFEQNLSKLYLTTPQKYQQQEQPHQLIVLYDKGSLLSSMSEMTERLKTYAQEQPYFMHYSSSTQPLTTINQAQKILKALNINNRYRKFNEAVPLLSDQELEELLDETEHTLKKKQQNILTLATHIKKRTPQLIKRSEFLARLYSDITNLLERFPDLDTAIIQSIIDHKALQFDSCILTAADNTQLDEFSAEVITELEYLIKRADLIESGFITFFDKQLKAIEECESIEHLKELNQEILTNYRTLLDIDDNNKIFACIQAQLNSQFETRPALIREHKQAIENAFDTKKSELISGNIDALFEEVSAAKLACQTLEETKSQLKGRLEVHYQQVVIQFHEQINKKATLQIELSCGAIQQYEAELNDSILECDNLLEQARQHQSQPKQLAAILKEASNITCKDPTPILENVSMRERRELIMFVRAVLTNRISNKKLNFESIIAALEQLKTSIAQLQSMMHSKQLQLASEFNALESNARRLEKEAFDLRVLQQVFDIEDNSPLRLDITNLAEVSVTTTAMLLQEAQPSLQLFEKSIPASSQTALEIFEQYHRDQINKVIETEYQLKLAQHNTKLNQLLETESPSGSDIDELNELYTSLIEHHHRLPSDSRLINSERYQKQLQLSHCSHEMHAYKLNVQALKSRQQPISSFTNYKSHVDDLETQKYDLQTRLATLTTEYTITDLNDDFYSDTELEPALIAACKFEQAVAELEQIEKTYKTVTVFQRSTASEKLTQIKLLQQQGLPTKLNTTPLAIELNTKLTELHRHELEQQPLIRWTATTATLGGADWQADDFRKLTIKGSLQACNFIDIKVGTNNPLPTYRSTEPQNINIIAFEILRQNLLNENSSYNYLNQLLDDLFNQTYGPKVIHHTSIKQYINTPLEHSIISPENIEALINELIRSNESNALDKASWLIKQALKLSLSVAFENQALPEEWTSLIDKYDVKQENSSFSDKSQIAEPTGLQKKIIQKTVIPYVERLTTMAHNNATLNKARKAALPTWKNLWNAITSALNSFLNLLLLNSAPKPKGLAAIACRLWTPCGIEARLTTTIKPGIAYVTSTY